MIIRGQHDGEVEAHIVGYQYPNGNDNWLLVATRVTTAQGEGRSVDPAWQTQEVRRMIAWFAAMADGVPVIDWGGACLERNLEFELVAKSPSVVTIRAHLILERGAWHPSGGGSTLRDHALTVDLEVLRADLRRVATDLDRELRDFPPRAPEPRLPSPFP